MAHRRAWANEDSARGGQVRVSGFEHLSSTSRLMVKQEVEMMEAITGWETANEYRVFKDRSEIYRVREQSNGCSRQCLKSARPFTLYIADSQSGTPFLRCERPWRWYFHEMDVYDDASGELWENKEDIFRACQDV